MQKKLKLATWIIHFNRLIVTVTVLPIKYA